MASTGKQEGKYGFSKFAFKSPSADQLSSETSASCPLQYPTLNENEGTSKKLSTKRSRGSELDTSDTPSKKKIQTLQDVRLPDFLQPDLDILIVGFNPGKNSASHGHHYAGPGNHFWKCLHKSALVPDPLTFSDDARITQYGIGLTNIVQRPSLSSSDLSKTELLEGAAELGRKIREYHPKIVVFNGVGIYEAFSGKKNFNLGKQPDNLKVNGKDIVLYVMPSSSPRGSKWPRMEDKLPFYTGIAHLRDFLQGKVAELDLMKVTFPK